MNEQFRNGDSVQLTADVYCGERFYAGDRGTVRVVNGEIGVDFERSAGTVFKVVKDDQSLPVTAVISR